MLRCYYLYTENVCIFFSYFVYVDTNKLILVIWSWAITHHNIDIICMHYKLQVFYSMHSAETYHIQNERCTGRVNEVHLLYQ